MGQPSEAATGTQSVEVFNVPGGDSIIHGSCCCTNPLQELLPCQPEKWSVKQLPSKTQLHRGSGLLGVGAGSNRALELLSTSLAWIKNEGKRNYFRASLLPTHF